MELFVGLDVGTTGVKGILVDAFGNVRAIENEKLSMLTPKPGWAEQRPEDWWLAVKKVLRKLAERAEQLSGKIVSISTSGQMHSLVALDESDKPIHNAILWCDQRTHTECEEATEKLGGEKRVLSLVGNPILPGFTLPKILWLKKHQPELFKRIRKIMLPKDFTNFMLTGEFATEHSDASGTMLYDVSKLDWCEEVLETFEIQKSWLPTLSRSDQIVGKVKKNLAGELGLKGEVFVVAGGADNACAALGIGVIEPGDVMVSLGTSGTVVAPVVNGSSDPKGRVHFFAHTVFGVKYHMGVMLTATYSLEWFKERFLNEDYEKINEEVAKIPVGSNGVLFLPYLNGERTPHRDPHARGVFFGLSSFHSKWDVVRAIFEGVAFGIKDSFDILKELGDRVERIRITGGGSKSKVWNQMLADMLGFQIEKPAVDEGASYGAAMLACSGYTKLPLEKISKSWYKLKATTQPSSENQQNYELVYAKFKKLYAVLKDTFKEG
ncbi:xylulokinase [Pseudothermotoga sp.]|nr:xylulokinase [Pseudothermotoga sp.]MCX7813329.1 xylulokinase [Pseudothermotoga sp.]MDW8139682.1 xylulokinase [Pseudothermotoga sp.]